MKLGNIISSYFWLFCIILENPPVVALESHPIKEFIAIRLQFVIFTVF